MEKLKELVNTRIFVRCCLIVSGLNSRLAELAYSLLRTLGTSTISSLINRLTPFLHMDPVQKLPPEITSEIFAYLDPNTLLTASLASRSWRSRILDSRLWRGLYIKEGWRLNSEEIQDFYRRHEEAVKTRSRKSRHRRSDTETGQPKHKKRVLSEWVDSRPENTGFNRLGISSPSDVEGDHEMRDVDYEDGSIRRVPPVHPANRLPSVHMISSAPKPSIQIPLPSTLTFGTLLTNAESSRYEGLAAAGARLNWAYLYKQRWNLEKNWRKARFTNFQLPHPDHPSEAHRECIYVLQFTGKWLVSGSRDKSIRIWDLDTKRLKRSPLVGHMKSVLCLQFDPSEKEDIIMSGSSDRCVIIWRFSTGEKIHELTNAHMDSVLNLRFDKRFLVTCSKDRTIKIWNRNDMLPTDENYPKFSKSSGPRYPSYIVDTSVIPPSTLEAQIANHHIKSLPPFTLLMTLQGHTAAVNAIQIDNDEIVSASGDRLIKVWNIHNGTCLKTLVGHQKGIACVQFDSQRIVSGSNDDTVRIFDHASGAEVACLQGHNDLVRTVQAGFGDPPGFEETLRLDAMAVDREYIEAQRRGDLDNATPSQPRRSGQPRSTGSRLPQDITAIGAKIPPGGGGSNWARIVSGSYDQTIIIWIKDKEGKWVIGQRLRQEDAARASSKSPTFGLGPVDDNGVPPRLPPPISSQPADLQTRRLPPPYPGNTAASSSYSPLHFPLHPQPHAFSGPLLTPSAQTPNALPPPPPHLPPDINTHYLSHITNINDAQAAQAAHIAQVSQNEPPSHPTARIFKLQFDARNLVCASQDHRIVGWDFACGDKDLEEACRYFVGL